MNNVATIESARFKRGEPNPGDPAELEETFAQCAPRVREMLRYISRERNWVLHDRDPVTNWTRGRVTLLGDAAHPTHQYFAQGACMAMEDSVCLAHNFEKYGADWPAVFKAYQEERIVRAYRVVLSSRELGRLYHAEGVERRIRNSVMATKTPEDFYNGLQWLYGGTGLGGDTTAMRPAA